MSKTNKSSNKQQKSSKLKNSIVSTMLVGTVLLGGAYTVNLNEVDADELKAVYVVDGVDTEGNIPAIQYLVVGGEAKDFIFDSKNEGKLSYLINNTSEELTLKGLENKDVTKGTFETTYNELEDKITEGAVVDFGNIAIKGDLTQKAEDLLKVNQGEEVKEYLVEVKGNSYKVLGERTDKVTENDIKNKKLAVVLFIDKFNTEDKAEDETKDKEDVNQDNKDSVKEGNKEVKKEEPKKEEPKKEEVTTTEIDTSKPKGKGTFLGDRIYVGENENGVGTITLTYMQRQYFDKVLNSGEKYTIDTHPFYVENNIKSAQDLYDKFGIYNISEDIGWLYLPELDLNKNGVMGDVSGEPVIITSEVDETRGNPDGVGKHNEAPTPEEGVDDDDFYNNNDGHYDNETEVEDGGVQGNGDDEIIDLDEPNTVEGTDREVGDFDVGDIDYGTTENVGDSDDNQGTTTETNTEDEGNTNEEDVTKEDISNTVTNGDLTYELDDDGNIIRVLDKDGNVIMERDSEGNLKLLDNKYETLFNDINNGLTTAKTSNGKEVEVSKDGKVLPDTGVAQEESNVGLYGLIGLALGTIVVSIAVFFSRKKKKTKTTEE